MFFDGIPLELQSVMEYLASAKDAEEDVWLQDDLQIAWLTCLYAGRDHPFPVVEATQKVLGLHPDKVWPTILARRIAKGYPAEVREDWETLAQPALPPKKPSESVRAVLPRKHQA